MRRWLKHAACSAGVLAAACHGRGPAGPARVATIPGAEPELRIGLAVGAPYASIGGPDGGESLLGIVARCGLGELGGVVHCVK